MKFLILLFALLSADIAAAQVARKVPNRALDQDYTITVNDGGVIKDAITVKGSTGAVTMGGTLRVVDTGLNVGEGSWKVATGGGAVTTDLLSFDVTPTDSSFMVWIKAICIRRGPSGGSGSSNFVEKSFAAAYKAAPITTIASSATNEYQTPGTAVAGAPSWGTASAVGTLKYTVNQTFSNCHIKAWWNIHAATSLTILN